MKRKKNPSKILELIEDIKEDIAQIKDSAVRSKYLEQINSTKRNIVKMDEESPLTTEERKKILQGLNNFWKLVQLTLEVHDLEGIWRHYDTTLQGFNFNKFEKNVRALVEKKKDEAEIFKVMRPKIPKLMISNERLKEMINGIVDTDYSIYEANRKASEKYREQTRRK